MRVRGSALEAPLAYPSEYPSVVIGGELSLPGPTPANRSPDDIANWKDLYDFRIPRSVLDQLPEGGRYSEQSLVDGEDGINRDEYVIQVLRPPKWAEDRNWPIRLMRQIRANLNNLTNSRIMSFSNAQGSQKDFFRDVNPLGAVVHIDIPGDDGSVVVSAYGDEGWTFSTLTAKSPLEGGDGTHPVSGHRQFGWRRGTNGSIEIYTRALDRPSFMTPVGATQKVESFTGRFVQRRGWVHFARSVVQLINKGGGMARVIRKYDQNSDWDDARQVFDQ